MVGQFTRIIQHPTDVLNNLPVVGGIAPTTKPNPNKTAPAAVPDTSSTTGPSAPAPMSVAAQPPSGVSTSSSNTTPSTNGVTAPQAPLAQLPLAVAQVPLTALDLIKTTLPTIVDAIPLPGLAALPAFADALINPVQSTIQGLAAAASELPFLQYAPGAPGIPLTSTDRYSPQIVPPAPRVFAAGTDPLPRDVSPGAPSTPAKPTPPVKPKDTFAADNHIIAADDFRPGYPDYLRAAGLSEVAAVAVPGFAGIVSLTAAGGLVGYRQARAHSGSSSRAARFVN
ncbi:hypothetical protein BOO86_09585 [Mycobacterium sp. CBMA 234]|uniref:hypothetical protein n=1 Tax=Mycolicibacterium sp. CBMA 234 TaxID=1918495 RepID=UPI0012DC4BB3|nr:hypothetical protein [Mycolicibacterium sp. CBMA 234]MUL64711.1 hypothetical protein [Mycolicibacterium sp. CBMA 234]